MFKDKQVFVWMRMTETVVIVIASMMKTKMTTMIMIMNGDHGSRPLTKSKCIHSSDPTTANSKQMNTNNAQETPSATNNTLEGEAKEATKRRKKTNRKKNNEKTTFNKPFTITLHLNLHPRNIDVSHIGLVHLVGWFLTHKVLSSARLWGTKSNSLRTRSVMLAKVY